MLNLIAMINWIPTQKINDFEQRTQMVQQIFWSLSIVL